MTNNPSVGYNKGMKKEISHAARMLGKIKTPKKSKASAINGRLGGRPKGKEKMHKMPKKATANKVR